MPGCQYSVLSARGRDIDVDRFLLQSSLEAETVWRRDDPPLLRGTKRRRKPRLSGFSLFIADVDRRSSWHMKRVEEFLIKHSRELRRLRRAPGMTGFQIEFVSYRRTEGIQWDTIPASLLCLIAALGMDIEWSVWPAPSDWEGIVGEKIPRRPPAAIRKAMKIMKDQAGPRPGPEKVTGKQISRPLRSTDKTSRPEAKQ